MNRVCFSSLLLVYHCGSHRGWSSMFTFTTMPDDINWVSRIALFGDMGNINAQSLPRLQEESAKGMYDAIFHVGKYLSPPVLKCNIRLV